MIQKTIFVTSDGRAFETEADARVHETYLERGLEIAAFAASLYTGKQAQTIAINSITGWMSRGGQLG